jgi:hypothetical protein
MLLPTDPSSKVAVPSTQGSSSILGTLARAHNLVIKQGKIILTLLTDVAHEIMELRISLAKGIGRSSLTIITKSLQLSSGTSECWEVGRMLFLTKVQNTR